MPPPKKDWEEDSSSEEESSSASEAAPAVAGVPRRKFDDEEEDDSDVLDSWDAAEDSEVEREKAKKAAQVKAQAEAEAKAAKKSKTERIALRQAERRAARADSDEDSDSENDETEQQKKDRLRRAQKEADLSHAQDLFGGAGLGSVSGSRKGNTAAAAVVVDPADPNRTVDLGSLSLFNPRTKTQLDALGKTIAPLLGQHHKMPHYVMFFQELCKTLAKELPSDQVKKVASSLTAVSNEKMKAEKAGDKTGKKKGGKAKTTLVTTRNALDEDKQVYNEGDGAFGDDDFM